MENEKPASHDGAAARVLQWDKKKWHWTVQLVTSGVILEMPKVAFHGQGRAGIKPGLMGRIRVISHKDGVSRIFEVDVPRKVQT